MGRIYWIVLANSIIHIIIIFSQLQTPKFIIPSTVSPSKYYRPNYQKNAAPAKRVILFIMDYLNANTFYYDIVSAIFFFNLATNEEKLQPISPHWPSIAATYPKSGFRVPVSPLLVIYVGVYYRNMKSLSCSSNLTECLLLSWIFPKNNIFH